jgi:23S rRNA maturation mini-RNase III
MVRIERGNVVLKVQEHEVQRYLKLGYNVTDNTGKVLQEALPNDVGTLQKAYVEQKKRIEELETIVSKLTAENTQLAKSAKSTTTKTKKPETEE